MKREEEGERKRKREEEGGKDSKREEGIQRERQSK